jgi:Flp pilus assembly protein TadD
VTEDRESLLLRSVLELGSAGEWEDFLGAVCADEPTLLNSVRETVTITAAQTPGIPSPQFGAGEIVAERFEIRGALGAGGMGLVYEAIDRKLGGRRALKFARPGHFRRIPEEARAALSITHENICRIYEIHTTATAGGAVDFISMELIEGESLLNRARRAPLERAEIVDLARQLCRGMDAAHRAGILHLDLKTANVMLAPRSEGGSRLVIMDFGIAIPLAEAGEAGRGVAGTPYYIAPERWGGTAPAPSADVYAIGVILYEMLTGARPFGPSVPWAERMTRLPQPPSRSTRAPDARWDRLVLQCLEPQPARRPQSAGEVLAGIEKRFGPKTRRWWMAAGVAAAAGAPLVAFRDRIWPAPIGRLALLQPTGALGSPEVEQSVRGALYDLPKRLASARTLLLIPFEDSVRNAVNSRQLASSRVGATHVLNVTMRPHAGSFTLLAEVVDARSGISLERFQGEFQFNHLADLSLPLAGVVTAAFRLRGAARLKMNPAAYPAYAAGLNSLNAVPPDVVKALELFQASLRMDANGAPALTGMCRAYLEQHRVKQDVESLEHAKQFAERARSLEPDSVDTLIVLAAVEHQEGRLERALDYFRRAAELEPANWDVWRRMGSTLQQSGRDREAVEALRHAVQLAPGYYSTHRDLGLAYFRMSRPQEAVQEFTEFTRLAPGLSEAWMFLGAALLLGERDAEAERALRESIRLEPNRPALNNLAVLLRVVGRNSEAIQVLRQALTLGGEDATLRLNLANALAANGDQVDARAQWQKAGEIARGILRRNPRDAPARARAAYSMVRLGELQLGAEEALQAAQLAPSDYSVVFWATMALEAAGRRDDIFPLLSGTTPDRLRNLRRQPELAGLVKDGRFQALFQQDGSTHTERK